MRELNCPTGDAVPLQPKSICERTDEASEDAAPPFLRGGIRYVRCYRVTHQDGTKPPIDLVPTVLAAGRPLL